MKSIRFLLMLLFVTPITPAFAGDLGIRVVLSGELAPGVYGEVEIGNERPVLLYPRPVVIVEHRRHAPVYLHVPPGHARRWSKYCGRYHACEVPVYFVMSREYEHEAEYVRYYRDRDDEHGDHEDRDDDDREHGHGHGHERGHSDEHHGRGHD